MNLNDLVAKLTGQSITNGWDAVLALNAAQLNALFFQHYVSKGPTDLATHFQAIVPDKTEYWVVDIKVGPPEISFAADLKQQLQVKMFLLSGTLAKFDASTQRILNVIQVHPNESWLTGTADLAKVSGTNNQLGEVVLELGSGAYQPQIKGIDPDSTLIADLGVAFKTFFAQNQTRYPLGTILQSQVPACLQPTDFSFFTQAAPGSSGDGAVLVFIKTNGSGGTVGPLSTYPIPDGWTAALLVSNQVVFNQLLPPYLTQQFQNIQTNNKPIGTSFSGQRSGALWQAVGQGGNIDIGTLRTDNGDSTNEDGNDRDVVVHLDNFVVGKGGANLSVSWDYSWDQYWTYIAGGGRFATPETDKVTFHTSYTLTGIPSVDPVTDIVRFAGNGTLSVWSSGGPDWFAREVMGQPEIPSLFKSAIQNVLQSVFSLLQLPSVNTFAIANLLFPSQHSLSLQQAALPGDLLLVGQVQAPQRVTPLQVNLQPGETQQFNATIYGNSLEIVVDSAYTSFMQPQQFTAKFSGQPVPVTWDLTWFGGSAGSIDENGFYTPHPALPEAVGSVKVSGPVIVGPVHTNYAAQGLLTAVSKANSALIGRVQILVTPYLTTTVIPVVTDSNTFFDLPADVAWEINPPTVGSITTTGIYTAPSQVSRAETVAVTAINKSDTNQTASALMLVYKPPAANELIISPATLTLNAGQSFEFVIADATGQPVEATVTLNPNKGTISPGTASGHYIYTAPANLDATQHITVTASRTNPAQIGRSIIKLEPAAQVSITAQTQQVVYRGQDGRLYELWFDITSNNSTTVSPQGSVQLAASGLTDTAWVIYPSDAGSIVSSDENSMQAVYTAPAEVGSSTGAMVAAFDINEMGIRSTTINFSATRQLGLWKWRSVMQQTTDGIQSDTPLAAGRPSRYLWQFAAQVVYRGQDDHIYQLSRSNDAWTLGDLTEQASSKVLAAGDPIGYCWDNDPNSASQHVIYLGQDGQIHELWFSINTGTWADTTVTANSPADQLPVGQPAAVVWSNDLKGPTQHIFFRAQNSHIYEYFSFGGGNAWLSNDLTLATNDHATPASDPSAFVWDPGSQNGSALHVGYRDNTNSIHDLYRFANEWQPATDPSWLADRSLSPKVLAVGNPVGLAYNSDPNFLAPTIHWFYRTADGHIGELWSGEKDVWGVNDLFSEASKQGQPMVAATDILLAYVWDGDVNQHSSESVIYRGVDNHLYALSYGAIDHFWTLTDLTKETGAPLAADK